MNTTERVKLALPLASASVKICNRLAAIDAEPSLEPDNIFSTPEEAELFDEQYHKFEKHEESLAEERRSLLKRVEQFNRWGTISEPPTLIELLSGRDEEKPIRVLVTIDQLEYRVYEGDDGKLTFK